MLEALENLSPFREVRATFMGADTEIRTASLARLDDVASLLRQHPSLRVCIDAHTGRHAPNFYAPHFTWQRAVTVAQHLASAGVAVERITARGWGKRVAIAAGWQPGLESARAELYFSFPNGLELPPRPECYEACSDEPPVERDDMQVDSDMDSDAESSASSDYSVVPDDEREAGEDAAAAGAIGAIS